ncbi:MAG TPA: enoyl-CoA hydratase/isomerase family protein [Acidimicrobiia bacterium]|nr:enoyl-CoA hydratase/isomerase family protein [Acidimicrobiia bacterium]
MTLSAVEVVRSGPIGTIRIKPVQETIEESIGVAGYVEVHLAVAQALEELRWDDTVRIVVLTGQRDGQFHVAPAPDHYDEPSHRNRLNPLTWKRGPWSRTNGSRRAIEALVLTEKPVIARLNGDAIGFGQSLMFGCDLIVAREDAVISDVHMGLGEVTDHTGARRGFPFGLVPGDGALAFVPVSLPPTKAKEYLFLAKSYTARELAAMNIVNYAVPMEELDAVLDDLTGQLLARPARALAMTKRACNKHIINQWNLAFELGLSWEEQNLFTHGRDGWVNDSSFED